MKIDRDSSRVWRATPTPWRGRDAAVNGCGINARLLVCIARAFSAVGPQAAVLLPAYASLVCICACV